MFKNRYKVANEKIKPDAEFLSSLEKAMENQRRTSKKAIFIRISGYAVSAVACGAMIFLGISVFSGEHKVVTSDSYDTLSSSSQSELHQHGNNAYNPPVNQGVFADSELYSTETDDPEKLALLAERMNSEELKYAYSNNVDRFDESNIMDSDALESLVSLLSAGGTETDDSPSGNAQTVYYMAVFTNGDIVKFSISDSRFFICKYFDKNIYLNNS